MFSPLVSIRKYGKCLHYFKYTSSFYNRQFPSRKWIQTLEIVISKFLKLNYLKETTEGIQETVTCENIFFIKWIHIIHL